MEDTIQWLIAIVVAFVGIGISFLYQGRALMKPEDSKRIGWQLRGIGALWIAIGIIFLTVVIFLQNT